MGKNRKKTTLSPSKTELIYPTYNALKNLGGTASNRDICNRVITDLCLSDEVVDEMHTNSTTQTELEYKLAWCRTYLKKYGVITDIKRGVWTILPQYIEGLSVEPKRIVSVAKGLITLEDEENSENSDNSEDETNVEDDAQIPYENQPWRQRVMNVLLKMDPFAFERLAKRILYVSGFTEVKVTKQTGDGGIDGTGKLSMNGIFTFNVAFQCKRFKGQVSAPVVQAFRGALAHNIEKGVIITTGNFTSQAIREAADPSKMQIDLIDGNQLIDILAKYELGLSPKTVYEVDEDYFKNI